MSTMRGLDGRYRNESEKTVPLDFFNYFFNKL